MLGILGVILGAAAIVLALTRGAAAIPPQMYIPTVGEIGMAESLTKLNSYYDLINELYISGQISQDEYLTLYNTYESRFYELMEGA